MPTMTIKEWAAEYKLINEAEREELKQRLPHEPIKESVRSYFALCQLALAFSGTPDEPAELQPSRFKDYQMLIGRWTRLAQRQKHVDQSPSSTANH